LPVGAIFIDVGQVQGGFFLGGTEKADEQNDEEREPDFFFNRVLLIFSWINWDRCSNKHNEQMLFFAYLFHKLLYYNVLKRPIRKKERLNSVNLIPSIQIKP